MDPQTSNNVNTLDNYYEELRIQAKTCRAFKEYRQEELGKLSARVSKAEQQLEPAQFDAYFKDKFEQIREGIESNHVVFDYIYRTGAEYAGAGVPQEQEQEEEHQQEDAFETMVSNAASRPNLLDKEKVIGTLKQMHREWSAEGARDRNVCFGLILDELQKRFPNVDERPHTTVLVPGCGLGRLPFEIAALGFDSQGNEVSYHMIFASCLLLNFVNSRNMFRVYPFIHSYANHRVVASQTQPILIPDVNPQILTELPGCMSMASGSFDDIYPGNVRKNAICTVFFIDTSPNIFKTLKTIYNTLEDDGVWINFGPLLWHFEDSEDDCGLELSLDQVISAAELTGFEFVERKSNIACSYTRNGHDSLGGYEYSCEYWVAKKR